MSRHKTSSDRPGRGELIVASLVGLPAFALFFLSLLGHFTDGTPFGSVLSAVCHRIPDRTVELPWGRMGLCARCTGFWFGLFSGTVLAVRRVYRPPFRAGLPALTPMVADGLLQLHTAYESCNALRMSTGFLAGLGMAAMFFGKR